MIHHVQNLSSTYFLGHFKKPPVTYFRRNVFEQPKVCLLLGVSIHREIFFENVLPDHAGEWRVMTRPGSFSHSLLPSARL